MCFYEVKGIPNNFSNRGINSKKIYDRSIQQLVELSYSKVVTLTLLTCKMFF